MRTYSDVVDELLLIDVLKRTLWSFEFYAQLSARCLRTYAHGFTEVVESSVVVRTVWSYLSARRQTENTSFLANFVQFVQFRAVVLRIRFFKENIERFDTSDYSIENPYKIP